MERADTRLRQERCPALHAPPCLPRRPGFLPRIQTSIKNLSSLMKRTTLLAAALLALVAAGSARAQSFDAPAISQGNEAFEAGRFSDALSAANKTAKDRNASAGQRFEAYRLQGLAYAALGQNKKARKAVDQMVLLNPSYQSRQADSPAFSALVVDAQERYATGDLKMAKKGVPQMFYNVVAGAMSVLTIYLGVSAAMAM